MTHGSTTAAQYGPADGLLTAEDLHLIDAYWRAANYLSVGQIYLLDNPLLREPLRPEHVKRRLLGHWGTTPGLNFVYAHLNRLIHARDLDAIYVIGPGHGAPAIVANAYLEGTYTELYPSVGRDLEGLRLLFRQFSFPGGIPSHVAPEVPGSIHEGGELGYSLAHAYGAAFDNPDLWVFCVVGDGEAETGPLAAGWHSNKFLNPQRDGVVLPILHLNGYKIANPTVLARIPEDELRALLEGCGYQPHVVTGEDPADMHQQMAATLDRVAGEVLSIQREARGGRAPQRPRWPMIVLRTPKGWTGPRELDGRRIEGTFRAHQVPIGDDVATNPEHLRMLEEWMRGYRPEELFDESGALVPELAELPPRGDRRMSANPHANGGLLPTDLRLPDFCDYAVDVPRPATGSHEATHVLSAFLRDVVRRNPTSFRLFGPDETASNRLSEVFQATDRAWMAELEPNDDHLSPDGRVMEVLSEHLCQGWLEGYLLTGRHGLFNCYEAFIHIVDSMFNQHAKWLKVTRNIPWRRPLPSLNYLLTSHVWRQDHNGFSHQDPGFIDHVVNKKAEIVRIYLPPDANTLLSVADHCLRSRHYVNVIVAGKQPCLDYLSMDDAILHCTRGIGIWEWASSDHGGEPDVVMACAGHAGDAGGGGPAAPEPAGAEGPRGQRGRPHAAAARVRASPRAVRLRVRLPLHQGPAGHLRLPRLPVADPPADLPPAEPPQPARARLQGGGHDHDAVRHGHAQRPGPLPPGHGRGRPRAGRWLQGAPRAPADGGRAAAGPAAHAGDGRGRAPGPRLDLALLTAVLVVNAGSTTPREDRFSEPEARDVAGGRLDRFEAATAVGKGAVHGGPLTASAQTGRPVSRHGSARRTGRLKRRGRGLRPVSSDAVARRPDYVSPAKDARTASGARGRAEQPPGPPLPLDSAAAQWPEPRRRRTGGPYSGAAGRPRLESP
jgi:xylulose-5-phosphate/fructose-6-phosphate phosphoketolase